MKKIKLLIIPILTIILTACSSLDVGPDKEELEKINLEPTATYSEENVRDVIKEIADKNLKKEVKYNIPENNPSFSISFPKDLEVNKGSSKDVGGIGITFENKEFEENKEDVNYYYQISIMQVDKEITPKYLYYIYNDSQEVDIIDIEGLDLTMHTKDGYEIVGEYISKDEKNYVITIKSKFNRDESIYIMKRLVDNIEDINN